MTIFERSWEREQLPFLYPVTILLYSLPIFFAALFAGWIPHSIFYPVLFVHVYGLVATCTLGAIYPFNQPSPTRMKFFWVMVVEALVYPIFFVAFLADLVPRPMFFPVTSFIFHALLFLSVMVAIVLWFRRLLEGRISRSWHFWSKWAMRVGLSVVFFGLALLSVGNILFPGERVVSVILLYLAFSAFLTVKRFHDLDRPGTHYWLLWVPLYYPFYLLWILLFKRGTDGPNQYGADPLAETSLQG